MKLGVYSIRDKKLGAYMTPFYSHNNETAQRSFEHASKNEQSPMFTHPTDYELYKLADFCDESGSVTPLSAPEFVISG